MPVRKNDNVPAKSLTPTLASTTLRLTPGLLLAGLLTALAAALAGTPWATEHGISPLTLAIVLGMVAGNTVYPRLAGRCGPGVTFARQQLLRTGIVLYGLRLTLQDVGQIGLAGAAVDLLVLASTFGLALWLGTRVLGLDRCTVLLIGAGSSICGAAAVLATEPVVRARVDQVAVAVATVVVFGTLAMFIYPILYAVGPMQGWVPGGAQGFGLYIGSTVHEVAQVVAAARAATPEAVDTAVVAKMVRVMMLAPFLLLLAVWLRDQDAKMGATSDTPSASIAWPLFPLAFIAMVATNSLPLFSDVARALGIQLHAQPMQAG